MLETRFFEYFQSSALVAGEQVLGGIVQRQSPLEVYLFERKPWPCGWGAKNPKQWRKILVALLEGFVSQNVAIRRRLVSLVQEEREIRPHLILKIFGNQKIGRASIFIWVGRLRLPPEELCDIALQERQLWCEICKRLPQEVRLAAMPKKNLPRVGWFKIMQ